MAFKPINPDVQFPKLEESVLSSWRKNRIVEKGLAANQGKKSFVFYDGPPFATGHPHYGHLLAGTLKDIVPRYWVMRGYHVTRRWGWDCHGLPVEFEMEKELGFKSSKDIEAYGVGKFNEACRGIVLTYTKEWEEIVGRTGRWVDFKNNYRTMDTSFMESVWWVFRQLWDKGLIYEGYRVMPYSWRISTPLSNFEAGLNYKNVQDPALTVKFKADKGNYFYLAWTTTPWTLPSNLALSVHPESTYLKVEDAKTREVYVLAKERLSSLYKKDADYKILEEFPGKKLEGETYEPLFPYFKNLKAKGAFKILVGEHVTMTEGTGIVHTAPAFGEEDFEVAASYNIPLTNPVDNNGNFTDEVPDYVGQNVKEADKHIIKDMKAREQILKHDTIEHSYPFCWRSDTPLIYRAIPAWFVKLDPIKKDLLANNQKTHWVPEHLRDGRFGNWLENARDWNISRNRYWGTPLPIWRCECKELLCIGSLAELEKLSGKKFTDIHKHFVDPVTIPCPKCKKPMTRIPEVLDCWFESGSMPYAQAHYPFENKENFEKNFPADFIAEGIDQTRGWFYTLSVLSSALLNKPPFKNVIVNGLVLAEDGKKMSKRLKNYPDPKFILDTYGADALRAYLMNSPASHAEELRFSETGVKEVIRSVLLPLWNAYSFLVTYAIADGWDGKQFDAKLLGKSSNELDQWILSRLHTLIEDVDKRMEAYHLYEVVPEVLSFIDELTNWYIRLNRRRFWKEEKDQDKTLAYCTLYYVLTEFCKVLAPILPFVTEEIYTNLTSEESVHLAAWPKVRKEWVLPDLEKQMSLIETIVSMGRTARNAHTLKMRQPLKELLVITRSPEDRSTIEKHQALLSQELNVKKVSFTSDEAKWVTYAAKPNSKVLGPKLGSKMQAILKQIKALPSAELVKLEENGSLVIDGETILFSDVEILREPKQSGVIQSSGKVTIWLDTALDTNLVNEGIARELVSRIQKLRKDMGLQVTDRIRLAMKSSNEIQSAAKQFSSYIQDETLAQTIDFGDGKHTWTSTQEIDSVQVHFFLQKEA